MAGRTETASLRARMEIDWETPEDHEMSVLGRTFWKVLFLGPLIAVPAYLMVSSPFWPKMTAMHYLSASGCTVAGYLGTAPAAEGEPGYHGWLDTNDNGVACEPEVQRAPRGGGAGKFVRPGE